MKGATTVAVVVPTLDRPNDLSTCLDHLARQTFEEFSVIVVDSGTGANKPVVDSFRDELDMDHRMVPRDGLPRARNRSLRRVDADIVAFCDEDAEPVEEWIEAIIREFEQDTAVGAVGGPVLKPGETLRPRDTVAKVHDNGEITDNFDADQRTVVGHLRGTNMAFRTELLQELGGFDPAYQGTAHFEDTDATYKVHQAGKKVVYTPDAVVYHHHPIEDRDLSAYYGHMLGNWPTFFEKTDPSPVDRLSFYLRLLLRWLFYSITVRTIIRV